MQRTNTALSVQKLKDPGVLSPGSPQDASAKMVESPVRESVVGTKADRK